MKLVIIAAAALAAAVIIALDRGTRDGPVRIDVACVAPAEARPLRAKCVLVEGVLKGES